MLKVDPTSHRGLRPPEVAETALTLKLYVISISKTKTDRARGVARNLLRGGTNQGSGDDSPKWGPGAEYGNLREHQQGCDKKNDLR